MLLVCPKCSSRYAVDDALFGDVARFVRCSSCGHGWTQPAAAAAPALPPMSRRAAVSAPRPAQTTATVQPRPEPVAAPRAAAPAVSPQPPTPSPTTTPATPTPPPAVAPAALSAQEQAAQERAAQERAAEEQAAPAASTPFDAILEAVTKSGGAALQTAALARTRHAEETEPATAQPTAPAAAPDSDEDVLDFASDSEFEAEPAAEAEPLPAPVPEQEVEKEPEPEPEPETATLPEAAPEGEVPTEDAGDKVRAILRGRAEAPRQEAAPAAAEKEARLRAALMERSPSRWQAWLIPGAAAAAVLLLVGILVLARESIVRVLPGAATFYAALGFDGPGVVGAGLEFREVTSRREWAGTDEVLIVRGVVANVSKQTVSVPPVRVALYDIDEYEVQSMTVPNSVQELAAGSTVAFEARIPNPALKAQRIRVTFQGPGRHRPA